jgi:hypothetical protein
MNPNSSGSDYGFWHYRNVGKAKDDVAGERHYWE